MLSTLPEGGILITIDHAQHNKTKLFKYDKNSAINCSSRNKSAPLIPSGALFHSDIFYPVTAKCYTASCAIGAGKQF